MLALRDAGQHILLQYYGGDDGRDNGCLIPKDFLPASAQRQIMSLMHAGFLFPLDAIQREEVVSLFQKIEMESQSGYRFAGQLQKTYLVQLIHLLTKIQQRHREGRVSTPIND